MILRRAALGLFLFPLLLGGHAAGESPDLLVELLHDPFARPARLGVTGPLARAGLPQLRSTLVAGKRSSADLDGVIVRIGETHRRHRLLEVRAFSVLLEHEGRKTLVELTSPEEKR